MKYEEDSEDIEFPPCKINKDDGKYFKKKSNQNPCIQFIEKIKNDRKMRIIVIISGILLLILIIILIAVFAKKKPQTLHPQSPKPNPDNKEKKENGGYLILNYLIESNDTINIINLPPNLKDKEDFIIETINPDNRIRNLENYDFYNNNNNITYKQANFGILKLNISFNKPLSTMFNLFKNCKDLTEVDLTKFNSKEIVNMNSSFLNCEKLFNLDFTNFNSTNVESMDNTFENCINLPGLNLSSFRSSKLKSMKNTFKNCKSIYILDIKGFDSENYMNESQMNNNIILIKKESDKEKLNESCLS